MNKLAVIFLNGRVLAAKKATGMIINEDAFVVLLVDGFFKTFTRKPIADAFHSTEVRHYANGNR